MKLPPSHVEVSVLNAIVPCSACAGAEGISPHRATFRLQWRGTLRKLIRTACERTLADEIVRIATVPNAHELHTVGEPARRPSKRPTMKP